jgi:phosphoribosyl 1,2-cyclic phosphate phosphodiesterase
MKVTVLGSGTSQGVPVIACECEVCTSPNPKDKRLRSSILISNGGVNYCIDSGPDFRQQMLRAGVKSLSGILYTHEHKDHIAGMDDVRAFNYREERAMELYCSVNVEEALRREFHYVFLRDGYPGIPQVELNRIDAQTPFELDGGLHVIPIEVMHYKLPVLGFRFGDFAYITDAKTVAPEEMEKLKGVKVLMVNALRIEPHLSHFNLEEAIAFIRAVNPEKTYLTHISHLFGDHDSINAMLPDDIFAAYDGLEFEVN